MVECDAIFKLYRVMCNKFELFYSQGIAATPLRILLTIWFFLAEKKLKIR